MKIFGAVATVFVVCACRPSTKPNPPAEPQDVEVASTPSPESSARSAATASPDAAVSAEPERGCANEQCTYGFFVEVEPRDWKKGKYRFDISADGLTKVCEATLPLPPCEQDKAVRCKGDEVPFTVVERGCARPPGEQGFGPFHFVRNPTNVTIAISRDGKVVKKAEFAPRYEQVRPNGPKCEPSCERASATMRLD